MAIKYYITQDYWELDYKSPNVKKLETCSKEGLTLDYLIQQASETIHDHLNVDIKLIDQYPNKIQDAVKYATAMLVDHYLVNGTNFNQINTSNSTDGVSESISWLGGFDPSILPVVIVSKLANEGLYYTLTNESDIIETVEDVIITDEEVYSISTRPNLLGKSQREINEQVDTQLTTNTNQIEENRLDILEKVDSETYVEDQAVQDEKIEANRLDILTKVDQTQYDVEQNEQDIIIEENKNRSENNTELILSLEEAITAGGVAQEIFKTTVDATITQGTPLNNNAPIKINSTRPTKLNYTQETGYKTFDVYDNGTFAVSLNGDVTSTLTNPITVRFELVDFDDNVVVDSVDKTFDFVTNSNYANQVASLYYSVANIDFTTITSRRFFLRVDVLTVGSNVTIKLGADVEVFLVMTGGVASIATTDDVANLSNVTGSNVTQALNTLKTNTDTNTANIASNALDIAKKLDSTYEPFVGQYSKVEHYVRTEGTGELNGSNRSIRLSSANNQSGEVYGVFVTTGAAIRDSRAVSLDLLPGINLAEKDGSGYKTFVPNQPSHATTKEYVDAKDAEINAKLLDMQSDTLLVEGTSEGIVADGGEYLIPDGWQNDYEEIVIEIFGRGTSPAARISKILKTSTISSGNDAYYLGSIINNATGDFTGPALSVYASLSAVTNIVKIYFSGSAGNIQLKGIHGIGKTIV